MRSLSTNGWIDAPTEAHGMRGASNGHPGAWDGAAEGEHSTLRPYACFVWPRPASPVSYLGCVDMATRLCDYPPLSGFPTPTFSFPHLHISTSPHLHTSHISTSLHLHISTSPHLHTSHISTSPHFLTLPLVHDGVPCYHIAPILITLIGTLFYA